MSYDLTLLRPPDGVDREAALEEFYEERTDDWPERPLSPVEEQAVGSLAEYAEVLREGTYAVTVMLPFVAEPIAALAHLNGALPHLQTLVQAGFVVDDPQEGRVVPADELVPLLRRTYAGSASGGR